MIPRMKLTHTALLAACALVSTTAAAQAAKPQTTITPLAELRWTDAGIPGVATAAVDGDMKKGASHFFLRYASGFVAPLHHHSPDHHVVTISGNLVLVVDGKDNRLPPGSYFSLKGKAPHAARCEGSADCVMFVDARGPWDVVPVDK